MSIIKGIDRIAIVLALVAMVVASFMGAGDYYHATTKEIGLTKEFIQFIKQEYRKEIDEKMTNESAIYELLRGNVVLNF